MVVPQSAHRLRVQTTTYPLERANGALADLGEGLPAGEAAVLVP